MGRFARIRRPSLRECRLLVGAGVLLPATALGLRWLGFRRTKGLLARLLPLHQPPPGEDLATRRCSEAARAVGVAARYGLPRATCLPRSLVLWGLLRRQGVASSLCVGVRRTGGQVEAHAWVERDGIPLNDTDDVSERFAAFPAPAACGEDASR